MNISFLTSGHYPYDDRIFWHLGISLSEAGHSVEIVSSKSSVEEIREGITINSFAGDDLPKKQKISFFTERLTGFLPDLIICSEPLPCLAARMFKKNMKNSVRIIYDITEWYLSPGTIPGKGNLRHFYLFLTLLSFNIYASINADTFLFGEWYKSWFYRILFPFKPFAFVSYYPDLKYLPFTEPEFPDKRFNLV